MYGIRGVYEDSNNHLSELQRKNEQIGKTSKLKDGPHVTDADCFTSKRLIYQYFNALSSRNHRFFAVPILKMTLPSGRRIAKDYRIRLDRNLTIYFQNSITNESPSKIVIIAVGLVPNLDFLILKMTCSGNSGRFACSSSGICDIGYMDVASPTSASRTVEVKFEFYDASKASIKNSYCCRFIMRAFVTIVGAATFAFFIRLHVCITIIANVNDIYGFPPTKQEHARKSGETFAACWFQPMFVNAKSKFNELQTRNKITSSVFKVVDNPRIAHTRKRLCKQSLVEMLHFLTTLNGNCSVLEPHPTQFKEIKTYTDHLLRRLRGEGGLTCYWWAHCSRNLITFDKRVVLDVLYIKQRLTLMGFKLMIKSISITLAARGSQR